jgi:hypothetical protein
MGFPPDIHKRFLHDILDARLIGPSAGNERTNAGREKFEQEFKRVLIAITRNGTQKTRQAGAFFQAGVNVHAIASCAMAASSHAKATSYARNWITGRRGILIGASDPAFITARITLKSRNKTESERTGWNGRDVRRLL